MSVIITHLSFANGMRAIHSFKIQSVGKTLKKVIVGNKDSESQPEIHVHAPETDGDVPE